MPINAPTTRVVLSQLAWLLLITACGDDGAEMPSPSATTNTDAAVLATPTPDAGQLPGTSGSTNGGTGGNTGQVVPENRDAATTGIVLVTDAGTPQGGGTSDAGGPVVITIPTRTVTCGGQDCTTTNNRTCCDSWDKDTGFANAPKCTTQATCTSDHTSIGDTNRVVMSDCDEPADCSGGQVCCFVRYGAPVTAELLSSDIVGPGASRLCMELSNCNAGMQSITGVAGVPIGLVACKTNADCTDGTQCTPEQADSTTTGKGGVARPDVLVCQ